MNFEDARGAIRDIFPNTAPECVTLITTKSGAIRGNHKHLVSTQHTFVVSGMLETYSRVDGELSLVIMKPGDLMTHEPGEEHAYRASSDVVFLAFAEGLRKGDDYEKDTVRVSSLVEAWNSR